MFERNPVDNINAMTYAVEVSLADGTSIVGRAALDKGKPVHLLLNGDGNFVYIERPDGEGDFVPKSDIKGLRILKPIKPRALHQPSLAGESFDPGRVLGVETSAAWEDIHAAYRRLAKMYHPDRLAGIELPPEVTAYMEAKAKQVNQAFRLLKSARSGGRG